MAEKIILLGSFFVRSSVFFAACISMTIDNQSSLEEGNLPILNNYLNYRPKMPNPSTIGTRELVKLYRALSPNSFNKNRHK
ncbi:hypothetical protein D3C73_744710 [compost metagenome]